MSHPQSELRLRCLFTKSQSEEVQALARSQVPGGTSVVLSASNSESGSPVKGEPPKSRMKIIPTAIVAPFQVLPIQPVGATSLLPEEETYHTETVPFLAPCSLPVLNRFEDDHPALQKLYQNQYAIDMTSSLTRMVYANRVKEIYDGNIPFTVNVMVLNKHDHFVPITEAKALPCEVKVTRRGDWTKHVTIHLVYTRELVQYYNKTVSSTGIRLSSAMFFSEIACGHDFKKCCDLFKSKMFMKMKDFPTDCEL